jgi:uncharacterized protein
MVCFTEHFISMFSLTQTNGHFATLNVRMPSWTSLNGAKATLNDKDLELAYPGMSICNGKQLKNILKQK